tara:strand:+ start:3523 stop:3702 length:180 start_codon:yes stop_codon:yes gene_type:complete
MNTKLHAICDSQGRPLNLFVTADQVSDYIGAWRGGGLLVCLGRAMGCTIPHFSCDLKLK